MKKIIVLIKKLPGMRTKMDSKKNFFKLTAIIGYNVIILICMLVGMEGLCRWLQIPYRETWTTNINAIAQFDPDLGWSYIPNLSTTVSFGKNKIRVYFDPHGIRIPDPNFRFDYSKPSVLFVGGSFTMGHGLSYEETFPGKLSKETDFPLQVVNLGVQAYGTDQSFLALKKHIARFNTKIVVYTFIYIHIRRNGNYDRRTLFNGARFLGTKPLFTLDKHNKLILKKKPLLYKDYHHSWLWDACKISLGRRIGMFPPYPVELTRVLINEMKKLCEANNAQLLVLYWRRGSHEPENVLDGIDVPKIDLLNSVPPGFDNLIIPEDGHPNAEANEIVAQILSKSIKTLLQK